MTVSDDLPERRMHRVQLDAPITFHHFNWVTDFHEHWHDYYEWIFYYDCEGRCVLNNTSYPITGGTSVLLSPCDFHRTEVTKRTETTRHIRICFTTAAIPWFTPESGTYLDRSDPFLEKLLVLFADASFEERRHLLTAMLMRNANTAVPIADSTGDCTFRLVREAMSYLHAHFPEATLPLTARSCGVSAGYLSSIFPKYAGMTFETMLTTVRLDHARALLTGTDRTVTDVALCCGYSNLSHFLRTFKRFVGVTPTGYRQQNRQS